MTDHVIRENGTSYRRGTRCTEQCHRPTPVQCHCSVCHHTFGTVSSFDKHRKSGECVDPAAIGLQLVGAVWRFPSDERMGARKQEYRGSRQ